MTSNIQFIDALKLASAFLLTFFAFQIAVSLKEVILISFTALIIAIAMDQLIMRFEAKGVPRIISAIFLYLVVGISILIMFLTILPPLVSELKILISDQSFYTENLISTEDVERLDITPLLQSLSTSVTDNSGTVASVIFKVMTSLTTALAIFFIAFFLTINKGGVRGFVYPILPKKYHNEVSLFWDKIQDRVGHWLWGKTLSSLIIGITTFIGLSLLNIPYTISLAVFAFFLNFIPFVGPIIASIPAVLLGLSQSILIAVLAGLLYFFINSVLEPFVLTPIFMRKAIEINPAFLIITVISGAYLGGILGLIISIPTAAILYLIFTEYRSHFHSAQYKVEHEPN